MNDRQLSRPNTEIDGIFVGTITELQPYGAFVKFASRSGFCSKSLFPQSIGMNQLKEGMLVNISINKNNEIFLLSIVIIDAKTSSDGTTRRSKTGQASDGAIVGKNLGYSKEIWKVLKEGVNDINKVGQQFRNKKINLRAGHVAESDHVATFNTDTAFQGADAKAFRLDSYKAKSVDMIIKVDDSTVKEFSSKVYKTAKDSADAQRGYGSQERLVPKDQLNDVIDYSNKKAGAELAKGKPERNKVAAERKEVADKATDHIEHDGVKSKSRTREESREIAEKAKDGGVTGKDIVGDLGTRVKQGATQGAKYGALTSAALSTLTSTHQAIKDVRNGDKKTADAVKVVVVDVVSGTIDGAFKGAAAGAATAAARVAVEKIASQSMKKVLGGSGPAALAVATVEIAKHSIDYARGIKTADQFFDASKETAVSGSASLIGAEIGLVLAGPVGAVIGGIAGPWLVETGRSWFGEEDGSLVDLRAGLEQQLLLLENAMIANEVAAAYHMEQMQKMLSALSESDAATFPDRLLLN